MSQSAMGGGRGCSRKRRCVAAKRRRERDIVCATRRRRKKTTGSRWHTMYVSIARAFGWEYILAGWLVGWLRQARKSHPALRCPSRTEQGMRGFFLSFFWFAPEKSQALRPENFDGDSRLRRQPAAKRMVPVGYSLLVPSRLWDGRQDSHDISVLLSQFAISTITHCAEYYMYNSDTSLESAAIL